MYDVRKKFTLLVGFVAAVVCCCQNATAFVCNDDSFLDYLDKITAEYSVEELIEYYEVLEDTGSKAVGPICQLHGFFAVHEQLKVMAETDPEAQTAYAETRIRYALRVYLNNPNPDPEMAGFSARQANKVFEEVHEYLDRAISNDDYEAHLLKAVSYLSAWGVRESSIRAYDYLLKATELDLSRDQKVRLYEMMAEIAPDRRETKAYGNKLFSRNEGSAENLESSPSISQGTGFFISRKEILTAEHVVAGSAEVEVKLQGSGDIVKATIVAADKANDIALLSISPGIGVEGRPLPFADSEVSPGQDVVVVGFPLAEVFGREVRVTRGSVNSNYGINRDPRVFQYSAGTQGGSSGGPVIDEYGNVIGVVLSKLNAGVLLEATGDLPQNVNFALKAKYARLIADINVDPNQRRPADLDEVISRAKNSVVLVCSPNC